MIYTEEELIALGKKHPTELTEEEFSAVLERVRRLKRIHAEQLTQLKKNYPQVSIEILQEVVEGYITIEEALSNYEHE